MPLAITSYDINECEQDVEMVKGVADVRCVMEPACNPFGSMMFYPNSYETVVSTGLAAYREHDSFALLRG